MCVHCGLCLNVCPTYLETGLEAESPRGRVALMKAVFEGRIGISDRVVSHWDLCLQCRACEVACPSGVPFGRLMEHSRNQVLQQRPRGLRRRLFRWLAFRVLLPHLGLLYSLVYLARVYQRTGLQGAIRRSGLLRLLPWRLGALDQQLPWLPRRFFKPSPRVYPARGSRPHAGGPPLRLCHAPLSGSHYGGDGAGPSPVTAVKSWCLPVKGVAALLTSTEVSARWPGRWPGATSIFS